MPNRSRQKGDRMERAMVRLLQEAGIAAERIPMSGSAGGSFCGDLTVPIHTYGLDGGGTFYETHDRRFECKKRANGFRELYAWIAEHYGLIVAADRETPLVVLRISDFVELVKGRAGA